MKSKTKWLTLAIGGLLLNGAGLSVFGEAIIRKAAPAATLNDWFWLGTISLVMINAGICLLVEATRSKP